MIDLGKTIDEANTLGAIEVWAHEVGGWTREADRGYVKGYEDAQEIVRGLVRAHTEPVESPTDGQTLAALNAFMPWAAGAELYEFETSIIERMRAALRAAGGGQ